MENRDERFAALERTIRECDNLVVQLRAELQEALAARDHAHTLLDTLLDRAPIGFAIHDRELRCVRINAALAEMNGIPAAEHVNRRLAELLPTHAPVAERRMRRVLATGHAIVNIEESGVTANGGCVRHWLTSYYPVVQPDGAVVGVGVFVVDMSQRVQMEAALRVSEARYRSLVERLPLVIYQADLADANRSTYVSPQIAKLLGYSQEEWLDDPTFWLTRVHPDDKDRILAEQARFQETGVPLASEHRMLARDGRVVWVHDESVVVTDEAGGPSYLQGFTQDITARKALESHLRHAQAQSELERRHLETVLNLLPVGVLITDACGHVVRVNTMAHSTWGDRFSCDAGPQRVQDVAGWWALSGTQIASDEWAAARALARGEVVLNDDCWIETCASERRRVLMSAAPLVDAEAAIVGATVVFVDITERIALEQKMQEAQRLESLGLLAGGIAHDFNNLLTVILGNAELAQADLPAGSPIHQALTPLVLAAQRATDLTRQMLAYAGRGPFQTTRLDLNTLIARLAPLLHAALPRTVAVVTQLTEMPARVEGDETQLQQVVMNLVINGSEAIGTDDGTVTISTVERTMTAESLADYRFGSEHPPGRYIQLTVADTGCGMEASTRERIFDPFFTTKFTGRGLGLAAVLGIVRTHRGALRVDSLPGRGTTFTLLLPVAPDSAARPDAFGT
jgi:two-component system, cell cycle sensor histidine kinase and response regulator CckA